MLNLLKLLLLLRLAEIAPDDADLDEDEEEEEEEPIRDPEKQALSREAGNWRKKFRAAEARIKELEEADSSEAFQEARMENAFLRAVMERGGDLDLDTAWDLLHVRGFVDTVTVSADSVTGMDEALEKLLDRYPWLPDEVPETGEDDEPANGSKRTPTGAKRRKAGPAGPSQSQLKERFPSLARRR